MARGVLELIFVESFAGHWHAKRPLCAGSGATPVAPQRVQGIWRPCA